MAILENIKNPSDLKKYRYSELNILAEEIRNFLVESVSKTGGHLASNLGVVELTIALHRVYNMPYDKIIWDVGHQSYVHKILTGRKDKFDKLRQFDGIAGFPRPNESEYDTFASGHSSTSISAALGIARARDIKREKYHVAAVIGDGALTGGMALEALNDAGASKSNIVVILNDNNMSISKNVGGISEYLSKIRTDPKYINLRNDIETVIKRIPNVGNSIYKSAGKLKEALKVLLVQGMLFEEFGFKYLGPIDGHNIEKMVSVIDRAKKMKGPVLIHVITTKGKGYPFAEDKPEAFHGVGPFEIETGEKLAVGGLTYSKVLGEELVKKAKEDGNIAAVTAAMPDGTGLSVFAKNFPSRFFDVGIAEQHAVTMAAGLATGGIRPVVAIYSTFLQRAYDQIIHDVCLQNLPVIFAVDRAGIVGEDGETHQGLFDLSFMSSIPNLTILAPASIGEFRKMLSWCFEYDGPTAIRYPRGGDFSDFKFIPADINYGKWEIINEGSNVAVLACGKMVQHAYEAHNILEAEGIGFELVNCRFIKPIDEKLLIEISKKYGKILVVEDNYVHGGFGESVLEVLNRNGYKGHTELMGFPDEFVKHGSPAIIYKKYGLDRYGIADKIASIIKE